LKKYDKGGEKMGKRKNEKKQLAKLAKIAAKEERKKTLDSLEVNNICGKKTEVCLTEKQKKVIDIIKNTSITDELLQRFSGSPLPLFLEPLPEDIIGYRVTYINKQDVAMPANEELEKLREYDGKLDYRQLFEFLSWNIRKVVLAQEENCDYEAESKAYILSQLFNQADKGDKVSIKKERITITRGKRVYKTDTEYSGIDTDGIFYMKAEGLDPFGGPNWKPKFKGSRESAVMELEQRIRKAAEGAKAETGPNSAYPELLRIRQAAEKWILLYGTQVRMMGKPVCYVKPFDEAEYAEDLFCTVRSLNGCFEYIWHDSDMEIEFCSENFWNHFCIINELFGRFNTRIRYKGGSGLMRGGTEIGIQITNGKNDETRFIVESMPHTCPGWENCIRESFAKLKEHYDNVRKEEWKKLAEDYPLAFTDAASIRIAREMRKGTDIDEMQKNAKYITAKEFNRRIDALSYAGVINVFNARFIRKGYGGSVWEMCCQPPVDTGYDDVDSLKIYLDAKSTADITQRRIKMLQCSGGFLSVYIDELLKEFKKSPKPIRDILEMRACSEKDKKKAETIKMLLKHIKNQQVSKK